MSTILRVAYEVIAPILISALFGFIIGRRFQSDPKTLSRIAIYLFLPALAFTGSANTNLQPGEIGQIFVLIALYFSIMAGIVSLLARTQRNAGPMVQSAFMLSALLANTGNYGLPFVEFAFGSDALAIAVIVFTINSIANNTLGIYVASSGKASIREGIRNVLSVPVPYAILLGFMVKFGGIEVPLPLGRSITLLSQASVPIMVTLLGIQLSRIVDFSEFKSIYSTLALASAARLLLSPLLVLLLVTLLGITGLTRNVLLVQLSAPTAVVATLLATEFGSDARFVTAVIFITTLASLVTLSIIMAVLVT